MTKQSPLDTSLDTQSRTLLRTLRQTPVQQLELDSIELFAKLEYYNPVGSLKDRAAAWILHRAIERGEIDQNTTIIESSSGNFASALAFYCKLLELRFIPVIDPNITDAYELCLRSLCPTVVKVTERDDTGGFLKTRLKVLEETRAAISNSYWTKQYENMDGVEAHYRLTGEEICTQFASLDYVFIGVSTAATIAGISQRLKEKFPNIRIIAVDAEGSVIFGDTVRKRFISGIGASIRPKLVELARIDDVVIVPEFATVAACRELLARHGLLVGGSSGSCYAAIMHYLPKMRSIYRPKVLFLCADRGTAYANTIFDNEWVSKHCKRSPKEP